MATMKAQVKMFETVGILIVFFFLLVFGVSFYSLMQKSSFEKETEKNIQLESVKVAQKIAYLPETECAIVGIQIENCIDAHKIVAFHELLLDDGTRLKYFPILGYSNVSVKKIYPGNEEVIPLYEFTGGRTRKIPTFYPIVLYNATAKSYDFAVLEVDVYGI